VVNGLVAEWMRHMATTAPDSQLALIYLANDVLQSSKLGQEPAIHALFHRAFGLVLTKSLAIIGARGLAVVPKIRRVVNIWKDKQVFSAEDVEQFLQSLDDPDSFFGGDAEAETEATIAALAGDAAQGAAQFGGDGSGGGDTEFDAGASAYGAFGDVSGGGAVVGHGGRAGGSNSTAAPMLDFRSLPSVGGNAFGAFPQYAGVNAPAGGADPRAASSNATLRAARAIAGSSSRPGSDAVLRSGSGGGGGDSRADDMGAAGGASPLTTLSSELTDALSALRFRPALPADHVAAVVAPAVRPLSTAAQAKLAAQVQKDADTAQLLRVTGARVEAADVAQLPSTLSRDAASAALALAASAYVLEDAAASAAASEDAAAADAGTDSEDGNDTAERQRQSQASLLQASLPVEAPSAATMAAVSRHLDNVAAERAAVDALIATLTELLEAEIGRTADLSAHADATADTDAKEAVEAGGAGAAGAAAARPTAELVGCQASDEARSRVCKRQLDAARQLRLTAERLVDAEQPPVSEHTQHAHHHRQPHSHHQRSHNSHPRGHLHRGAAVGGAAADAGSAGRGVAMVFRLCEGNVHVYEAGTPPGSPLPPLGDSGSGVGGPIAPGAASHGQPAAPAPQEEDDEEAGLTFMDPADIGFGVQEDEAPASTAPAQPANLQFAGTEGTQHIGVKRKRPDGNEEAQIFGGDESAAAQDAAAGGVADGLLSAVAAATEASAAEGVAAAVPGGHDALRVAAALQQARDLLRRAAESAAAAPAEPLESPLAMSPAASHAAQQARASTQGYGFLAGRARPAGAGAGAYASPQAQPHLLPQYQQQPRIVSAGARPVFHGAGSAVMGVTGAGAGAGGAGGAYPVPAYDGYGAAARGGLPGYPMGGGGGPRPGAAAFVMAMTAPPRGAIALPAGAGPGRPYFVQHAGAAPAGVAYMAAAGAARPAYAGGGPGAYASARPAFAGAHLVPGGAAPSAQHPQYRVVSSGLPPGAVPVPAGMAMAMQAAAAAGRPAAATGYGGGLSQQQLARAQAQWGQPIARPRPAAPYYGGGGF
jgi:hypothetical protein